MGVLILVKFVSGTWRLVFVLASIVLALPLPPKLKFVAMQSGAALVFNLFFIWRVCVESADAAQGSAVC